MHIRVKISDSLCQISSSNVIIYAMPLEHVETWIGIRFFFLVQFSIWLNIMPKNSSGWLYASFRTSTISIPFRQRKLIDDAHLLTAKYETDFQDTNDKFTWHANNGYQIRYPTIEQSIGRLTSTPFKRKQFQNKS